MGSRWLIRSGFASILREISFHNSHLSCPKIARGIAGSGRNKRGLLLRLSLDSFLNTTWNSGVMYKQQVSNKSLTMGWLLIDPWFINTLGGETKERLRSRVELFLEPPGEHFHSSPFTEIIWKQHDNYPRQMFVCMNSEAVESSEILQANA